MNKIQSMYPEDFEGMYQKAVEIVKETKQCSASMLQRKLVGCGYINAARLIDRMEQEGLVSPYRGAKPREVYI